MASSKHSFSTTQHKIAFFFAVLCSVLLMTSTFVAILLIRWEISRQARGMLENALSKVEADFKSNRLEGDVQSTFQFDNTQSLAYQNTQRLPKVNEKRTLSPEEGVAVPESSNQLHNSVFSDAAPASAGFRVSTFDSLDVFLPKTAKNRQVYSRVISSNGDILFTSDLFESFNIDPQEPGFFTIENGGNCFHTLTSEPDLNGTVYQVGQYCAFTLQQQFMLFVQMFGVTIMAVIATYGIGWWMAGHLLKPYEKMVKQTRQFAENCYHELMTPLAVAMSSTSAALKSKEYKEGLESVDEDLKNVYLSLQTLSKHAVLTQTQSSAQQIHLSQMLDQTKQKYVAEAKEKDLQFDTRHVEKNVMLKAEQGSLQIILDNLFENAVKYSPAHTAIVILMDKQRLSFKNELSAQNSLQREKMFDRGYRGGNTDHMQGNGFGLAIVKELSEANGWSVSADINNNTLEINILWG